MRLIDADLLKERIAKWLKPSNPDETEMIEVTDALVSTMMEIDEQPTAFDVDRVLGKMHSEMMNSASSEFDYAMYRAIEIVKGGGVDGN